MAPNAAAPAAVPAPVPAPAPAPQPASAAAVQAVPKKLVGLPVLVSSPVDIGRLIREVETIDESLQQLALRKGGTEVKMPKTTQLMDQLIALNKLNLLLPEDRNLLHQFLIYIKEKAPVLHVSFSADPNTAFIEKLMAWLRREINPLVLMTIGLQPNIGAGCVIRSTNKYFDLSLKQDFASKTDLLRAALAPPAVVAPVATATPVAAAGVAS
jgi:hypothetical protein